jgi:hypothetical protein
MPERNIRVFISSPSDVAPERARAALVLRELAAESDGGVRFTPILWEENYYSAHRTFQDAIAKPSSCDLVLCILHKRLGTELPPEYNRADGTPRTGTEYEFEEALQAALAHETPDILVYRKRVLIDADRLGQEAAEMRALNAFWQHWSRDEHGNFSAYFDRFDSADEFHDKLKRQIRAWLARRSDAVTWPVATLGSPFRSLSPFEADHARIFFGRRRAIRAAVAKLTAAAARGCAFLLVLGGSGTGKSSLVRAGVVPFLTQDNPLPDITAWRTAMIRPALLGDTPLESLAQALALPDGDPARAIPESSRLIILVDQFEEVLVRPAAERDALIGRLDTLARSLRVWVIATVRNDRYAELQTSPALMRLKADGETLDLLPPGPAEIRDIIEGPARAAGLRYEESGDRSLAALLETAAGQRGALPLLQFTLQTLFEARDQATNTLTLSVYDRLGGLAGAIAAEAERLVATLPAASGAALAALLLKLVALDDGTGAASARPLDAATLSDPAARDLATRLIDARLLTIDGATLRLAHEALLTHWPRLADLVASHGAFLAVRQRVDTDAAAWDAAGRPPDLLLPAGRRLAEAAGALSERRGEMAGPAIAFIEASLAADRARRDAQAEAQRRDLRQRAEAAAAQEQASRLLFRRTRAAIVAVSLLLLLAASAAGLWLDQREVARRRAAEAEQNYATALAGANATLGILDQALRNGRITAPVKRALLKITSDALENLPTENEAPAATRARADLFISLATTADPQAEQDGVRGVELARALVAGAPNDPDAAALLQAALWTLAQRMTMYGELTGAAARIREAEAIAKRFADARPADADWQGKLNADQRAAGDIMRRRGDLQGALAEYRASKDQTGEADILRLQGRITEAAAVYRDHLHSLLKRAERNSGNTNLQRFVAEAHERMGEILLLQHDLDGAQREFEAAITVARALVQNQYANFFVGRTLYAAMRGAADIALARHDAAGALAQYQALMALVTKRIGNAPTLLEWQVEQAETDMRIADAETALGNTQDAARHNSAALTTMQSVLAVQNSDASWQQDAKLAASRTHR